jgi:hypothetical protein
MFNQWRSWLVQAIQFDEEWFRDWVKDHPVKGVNNA